MRGYFKTFERTISNDMKIMGGQIFFKELQNRGKIIKKAPATTLTGMTRSLRDRRVFVDRRD